MSNPPSPNSSKKFPIPCGLRELIATALSENFQRRTSPTIEKEYSLLAQSILCIIFAAVRDKNLSLEAISKSREEIITSACSSYSDTNQSKLEKALEIALRKIASITIKSWDPTDKRHKNVPLTNEQFRAILAYMGHTEPSTTQLNAISRTKEIADFLNAGIFHELQDLPTIKTKIELWKKYKKFKSNPFYKITKNDYGYFVAQFIIRPDLNNFSPKKIELIKEILGILAPVGRSKSLKEYPLTRSQLASNGAYAILHLGNLSDPENCFVLINHRQQKNPDGSFRPDGIGHFGGRSETEDFVESDLKLSIPKTVTREIKEELKKLLGYEPEIKPEELLSLGPPDKDDAYFIKNGSGYPVDAYGHAYQIGAIDAPRSKKLKQVIRENRLSEKNILSLLRQYFKKASQLTVGEEGLDEVTKASIVPLTEILMNGAAFFDSNKSESDPHLFHYPHEYFALWVAVAKSAPSESEKVLTLIEQAKEHGINFYSIARKMGVEVSDLEQKLGPEYENKLGGTARLFSPPEAFTAPLEEKPNITTDDYAPFDTTTMTRMCREASKE